MERGFDLEAVVLAGGLGTRLRSVISDIPKPMAPIGGKPFLEFIFKYLQRNGITRIILSVGYKWETISKYFGDSFEGIEIIYSIEEQPLGTGGAIKIAMNHVKNNQFYIINGDTLFDVDLRSLALNNNSQLMLCLKYMKNNHRYSFVQNDDDGLVTSFSEKGFGQAGNVNGGIYLSSRNIFDDFYLEDKFSFEEFMQLNFQRLKMSIRLFDNYFIDIGVPEDYLKCQYDLAKFI